MKNRLQLLFFGVLFITLGTAEAGPKVSTFYSFYEIYPSSKYDLNRAMSFSTPIRSNGEKFRGHTHWRVFWKFKWSNRQHQCAITSVETVLNVTYTMPRLAQRFRSDAAITQPFRKYYRALFNHEKGHMQSGMLAAEEIEKNILALAPERECPQLQVRANQLSQAIIKKYVERDQAYDRDTGHGQTQGVDLKHFL